ncbi:MAG: DNA alkylation repair protein [Candidatus Brocadiia bacterium]
MDDSSLRAIVSQARAYCSSHSDPAVITKYSKYFKEGYDAFGVPDTDLRALKDLVAAKPHFERGDIFSLADLLVCEPKYEMTSLVILLMRDLRGTLTLGEFRRAAQWLDHIRNWAHCDVLCGEVYGPCIRDGVVSRAEIEDWARAEWKWRRRALPVTLITSVAARKELAPLLTSVRPLMHDGQKCVQQGMGWFLREVWKADHVLAEGFLSEFKDTSPRVIFQYATEKMTPEGKERFRAAKKVPRS